MISLTAGSALILMVVYDYIDGIIPDKIFLSSEDVMELGECVKNNDAAKILLSEKIISGCLLTVRDEDVMADILKPGKEYDTRK
ncbi:hypothetical protein Q9K52_004305, partial [Escherichia coli]|nr:hypothetical protein [Escherichia coli]